MPQNLEPLPRQAKTEQSPQKIETSAQVTNKIVEEVQDRFEDIGMLEEPESLETVDTGMLTFN